VVGAVQSAVGVLNRRHHPLHHKQAKTETAAMPRQRAKFYVR
jgi:hypothetical protein